jgi:hypothetical protein
LELLVVRVETADLTEKDLAVDVQIAAFFDKPRDLFELVAERRIRKRTVTSCDVASERLPASPGR